MSKYPTFEQQFIAWKDVMPERKVYFDCFTGARPKKRQTTGVVVLTQPCRCFRQPRHRELYFTDIFESPDNIDPKLWYCEITRQLANVCEL